MCVKSVAVVFGSSARWVMSIAGVGRVVEIQLDV